MRDPYNLVQAGLLVSETAQGPVRLRFGVASADVLFPQLFVGAVE